LESLFEIIRQPLLRTLGTLVQSGVADSRSVVDHQERHGQPKVVANAVEQVHTSIKEGDTITEPLRYSGVFDYLVVNMIQVGEETGELDKMLIKVADTYTRKSTRWSAADDEACSSLS